MISLFLAAFVLLVMVAAPRLLPGRSWLARSPGLGIAAWYASMAAVITGALGAAVSVAVPGRAALPPLGPVLDRWAGVLWGCCLFGSGLVGLVVTVLTAAVFGYSALAIARGYRDVAGRRRTHREFLQVAGQPEASLGVTVIQDQRPAAYVVAGRVRQVVVTSGAMSQLHPDELAAVLAHERAHADGRHHVIVDGPRWLRQILPRSRFLGTAVTELARLVELRADDIALRAHHRLTLARALVAMAQHPAPPAAVSTGSTVGALALDGGDAMERLQRLLNPPPPLGPAARIGLSALLTLVASTPAILLVGDRVAALIGC